MLPGLLQTREEVMMFLKLGGRKFHNNQMVGMVIEQDYCGTVGETPTPATNWFWQERLLPGPAFTV